MAGPLSGIRVLDLSRILAGPWATQCLADLGADVIKVERPGVGDDTRTWGPPFFEDVYADGGQTAAYYMSANRNKRSIAIDITGIEGQAVIRRIAQESDIVVENFKVGGLEKYGLDYKSLSKINPGLIYCSITGFGQTGPYSERPGYDFLVQGLGGMMSITGERDDLPGGGPQKTGIATADIFTGLYGAIGILAALQHRHKTGEGQHIDMSLLDTQVSVMGNQALGYIVSGNEPKRMGNAHISIVPYQAFASRDGHVILAIGNDGQFVRFCKAAGEHGLAVDERFKTNPDRVKNRTALIPIIEDIMIGRTTDEWISLLEEHNVPGGPINGMKRVFDDVQVQARGLAQEIVRNGEAPMPTIANPIKFSKTEIEYRLAPPKLGEHTDAVLEEVLKLSPAERAALVQKLNNHGGI
ncbi:CaiB/BaiF CoA transferase family protein [Kordiimonas aquimaris]|uniref:CaiB/BaiF CoA transferase family protein n=1 Tax=Kordiimonas aquimaris TaxID=707591 RepID=UPI0021D38B52|nr:CaiB/BaiF CoA-transferase family protein [Kordiimonas aquimaris]